MESFRAYVDGADAFASNVFCVSVSWVAVKRSNVQVYLTQTKVDWTTQNYRKIYFSESFTNAFVSKFLLGHNYTAMKLIRNDIYCNLLPRRVLCLHKYVSK